MFQICLHKKQMAASETMRANFLLNSAVVKENTPSVVRTILIASVLGFFALFSSGCRLTGLEGRSENLRENEFPILVEDGKKDELQQREHTYGELTWSGSRPRANSKKGHKS